MSEERLPLREFIQSKRPGTSRELEDEIFEIASEWGDRRAQYDILKSALDEAGLMLVWHGPDKAQIVCKPGHFEDARLSLGLDRHWTTLD